MSNDMKIRKFRIEFTPSQQQDKVLTEFINHFEMVTKYSTLNYTFSMFGKMPFKATFHRNKNLTHITECIIFSVYSSEKQIQKFKKWLKNTFKMTKITEEELE